MREKSQAPNPKSQTIYAWAAALGMALALAACGPGKAPAEPKTVMFFGDSLTEGHGLAPGQSYPDLLRTRLREKGWNVTVVNAGVSGHTTADGRRRLDAALESAGRVDVFVLALGANDVLRRMDMDAMEANLSAMLERVRVHNPEAKLVVAGIDFGLALGMMTGANPIARFERVAEKHDATLIPNLLKGVINDPRLNLGDGVHPNAAGMAIVADNVWDEIKDLLQP